VENCLPLQTSYFGFSLGLKQEAKRTVILVDFSVAVNKPEKERMRQYLEPLSSSPSVFPLLQPMAKSRVSIHLLSWLELFLSYEGHFSCIPSLERDLCCKHT
jgi:hypothetical protein